MLKRLVFLAVVSVCLALDLREGKVYSNSWAVEVSGGDAMAESIARRHGFTNMGRVSARKSSPQTGVCVSVLVIGT